MQKQLILLGLGVFVIQLITSLGIFVRYTDMVAYAAPKDTVEKTIEQFQEQLNRIEEKLDKVILGY